MLTACVGALVGVGALRDNADAAPSEQEASRPSVDDIHTLTYNNMRIMLNMF